MKVPEILPAATVTVAGAERAALPLLTATADSWLRWRAALSASARLPATVTVPGAEEAALPLLTAIAAPPDAATLVSVTVQVLLAAGPRLVGLHASEATLTGATNETDAVAEVALYVAVTVAA